MQQPSVIRRLAPVTFLVFGVWALLVATFAGQLVFTIGLSWSDAILVSLRDWYPWILLAPVVAWLAARFPFERDELALSIPVHIAACILAVLACELLSRPIPAPLPPFRDQSPQLPLRDRDRPSLPDSDRGPGPPPGAFGDPARPRLAQRNLDLRRPVFMNALVLRSRFNIPVYWIIVTIVNALAWYRRSKDRERHTAELESRLAQAKLQALRMQLHPHFLFNTLNAISSLVHKDPNAADEMIANLSDLLRATLDTSEPEITLRRELEFLDRYLEIQQARFGDKLDIQRDLSPAALDQLVPALILQPIAENAIRHGLEPATGAGTLRLEARLAGNTLYLNVCDRASQCPPPAPPPKPSQVAGPNPQSPSRGVGLSNTRARLAELYGARASLTFTNTPGLGSTVSIEIPAHTTPLPPSP